MKTVLAPLFILCALLVYGQTSSPEKRLNDLPRLSISDGLTIHIIAPEPIQYVDLSSHSLVGDLPAENIARIKIADEKSKGADSIKTALTLIDKANLGVVTVVCQSFLAQYRIDYNSQKYNAVTNIQIQPEDMQPLEYLKTNLSNVDLVKYAYDIILKTGDKTPIREADDLKLAMRLNNIYVFDDYIFVDITVRNRSNLKYDIDAVKFSVEDKKIFKATNNQSIELNPIYQLYPQKSFRKNFRNIYVFKKFTFPNSKIMKIRLLEEQLSGRTIEMKVNYSDILKADTF